MKHTFFIITMIGLSIFLSCNKDTSVIADKSKEDILKNLDNYADLENLFVTWRIFENPPKNSQDIGVFSVLSEIRL
jgi:hypothetical protein